MMFENSLGGFWRKWNEEINEVREWQRRWSWSGQAVAANLASSNTPAPKKDIHFQPPFQFLKKPSKSKLCCGSLYLFWGPFSFVNILCIFNPLLFRHPWRFILLLGLIFFLYFFWFFFAIVISGFIYSFFLA